MHRPPYLPTIALDLWEVLFRCIAGLGWCARRLGGRRLLLALSGVALGGLAAFVVTPPPLLPLLLASLVLALAVPSAVLPWLRALGESVPDSPPPLPLTRRPVHPGPSQAPLRIAIFSEVYSPMVSGVAVTLHRLVQALNERGHSVRVYTATYDEDATHPIGVHRSPSAAFAIYPEIQWATPRREVIERDLKRFAPDLVHLATEFPMGVTGMRIARDLGIPRIASAHTDYERYADRYGMTWALGAGWHYLRWFYGQASRVLCPSAEYARHLNARGIAHTGIWTRGVDTERFHPRFRSDEYRRRFGVGPDDPLITCVGRLAAEKNIILLLDAWQRLGATRGHAQLVFVGAGPMSREIASRALPGVHLAGSLQGEALATAYASADLFAFPSSTETFGNVLLEAMASGVAAIAAAAGGVLDFARDRENALLVTPDSSHALAEQLATLIHDRDLRARVAAGGRETALGRNWSAIHDQLVGDYRQAAQHAALTRAA